MSASMRRTCPSEPPRRSQRIKNVQEKHLSTQNDQFWEREESTLLLAFSHLRVHELLRCAVACKSWRRMIDRNAIAWTTAMWELDPFAVFGPKGAKATVERLRQEGSSEAGINGQLWIAFAERLTSHQCAGDNANCPNRAFEMNTSTLERVCAKCFQNARGGGDEFETLINDFMFDKQPSAQVSTPQEFLDITRYLHEGACIEISGSLNFTEDGADILMHRVLEAYSYFRYKIIGADNTASIISRHTTLYFRCCMLQGLNIDVGDDGRGCECDDCEEDGQSSFDGEDYIDSCHPGIEIISGCRILLKDCNIDSWHGSALMVTTGGFLAAEGCSISSSDTFYGIILKDEGRTDEALFLSCRDCLFSGNQWGCAIPTNVKKEVVQSFVAANEFGYNADRDVTHDDCAPRKFKNTVLQPWRRGWATAA